MSEKTSKIRIGAFVLGALALMLIAVAVISSGRLFSPQLRFVVFFESSLRGLSAGSPVVFHGVPIGRVSAIRMAGDVDTLELLIPVYVELDMAIMKDVKHIASPPRVDEPYMQRLVKQGLRARLDSQSLLTGQLLIELDFFPDAHRRDAYMPMSMYDSLLVIPSIPSPFDTVSQRITELPVDQLVQNLIDVSAKIDAALGSQAMLELPGNINAAFVDARSTMGSMNTTMESFRRLAASMESVSDMAGKQAPETLAHIRRLMNTYISLGGQLERSLESVRGVVGPNTVPVLEFTRAVRELGETAKAVRDLAGMLERNPETLLMGKGAYRK